MELDIIYQEDCFKAFKGIEDKSIDLILTDPPYGVTACKWDTVPDLEKLWIELKRIGKDNCAYVFTASQPFTTDLINSNRKMFKYCWVWDKKKGGNIMNLKQQPYKVHEDVIVFGENINYYPIMELQKPRTGKTYSKGEANGIANYGDIRYYDKKYPKSIIEVSNANQAGKSHPTQKPVALFEYLIKTYTNEGDTVLDPFIGSGTTAIACINLNRHYIGCELEKKYYEIAIKRIEGVLERK